MSAAILLSGRLSSALVRRKRQGAKESRNVAAELDLAPEAPATEGLDDAIPF
jgi:hypothetical protein